MQSDFKGRLVVVTGGSGALGAGVVKALIEAGAQVLDASLPGAKHPFEGHPQVEYVGVDLTAEDEVTALYAGLKQAPWAALNLAGGFSMGALVDTPLDELLRMFDINVVTSFLSTREAVRAMSAVGRGRVVNVAARPALSPAGLLSAYSIAKAGVVGLTQSAAEELRGTDILVNAVAPSIIDSPANRAGMPDADHASWPTPEQLAQAILYLASPANELTSGAVVPVYGRA